MQKLSPFGTDESVQEAVHRRIRNGLAIIINAFNWLLDNLTVPVV